MLRSALPCWPCPAGRQASQPGFPHGRGRCVGMKGADRRRTDLADRSAGPAALHPLRWLHQRSRRCRCRQRAIIIGHGIVSVTTGTTPAPSAHVKALCAWLALLFGRSNRNVSGTQSSVRTRFIKAGFHEAQSVDPPACAAAAHGRAGSAGAASQATRIPSETAPEETGISCLPASTPIIC